MTHTARSIVGSVVAGVLLIGGLAAEQQTRTVYVSVTDKKGAAVTDLREPDFEIKIGGRTHEILSVRPAAEPLRIAMLVADAGTGGFQLALARFMRQLQDHAEFALTSVIVQPEKIVDYSNDAAELNLGLRRLGTRGRQAGAQLMEAIYEATRDVWVEAKRPVIVVVRVGGERPTELTANVVREALRKSGAVLYVISTLGAQRPTPSQVRGTDPVSVQIGQLRDEEMTDSTFHLAQVLNDGAAESGGRHDQVISTTLVPALGQVATELLHQYEIRYVSSENAKANAKLSVSSKRKGLTVRAPSRLRY